MAFRSRAVPPALVYFITSILLLAPCYWQPHVQAGDLASHVYNAWLAEVAAAGEAPGLTVVHQNTNILFVLGFHAAELICVGLCALIFVWGAFAIVSVLAGRSAWPVLPILAVFTYGYVYHMGFFNFYLSLGLCFWAMMLLWNPTAWRMAASVPILAVAAFAHALPLPWVVGLAMYHQTVRPLSRRNQMYVMLAVVAVLAVLHFILAATLFTLWSPAQIALASGLDQFRVFNAKYSVLAVIAALVCGIRVYRVLREKGLGIPLQVCVIGAAAVFLIPTAIRMPGFAHGLGFVADRMSLFVAICLCAPLILTPLRRSEQYALNAIATIFFVFLFIDEHALNAFESRMRAAVSAVPDGARVVSAFEDRSLRVNAIGHLIDRVCIGHCFSYANYEPSVGQFRVRATGPNPYAAFDSMDSFRLQAGDYVVKQSDLPLYQVTFDANKEMVIKSLPAGKRTGVNSVRAVSLF